MRQVYQIKIDGQPKLKPKPRKISLFYNLFKLFKNKK